MYKRQECGLIVCAMRHHSEEQNRRMLHTAREFLGAGVCAADLAGAEVLSLIHIFKHKYEGFNAQTRLEMTSSGNAKSVSYYNKTYDADKIDLSLIHI